MKKSNFVRNLQPILMFGAVGTLLSMIILSFIISYTNYYLVWDERLRISQAECLLLASVLCASDTIAAIGMLSEDKYKTLNAIMFGEGIVNDAVAILMFNSVEYLVNEARKQYKLTGVIPIDMGFMDYIYLFLSFINLTITSMLIGITFGFIASLTFKRVP